MEHSTQAHCRKRAESDLLREQMRLFMTEIERRKEGRDLGSGVLGACTVVVVLVLSLPLGEMINNARTSSDNYTTESGAFFFIVGLVGLMILFFAFVAFWGFQGLPSRKAQEAAKVIAATEEVKAVGVLVEMQQVEGLQRFAVPALIRLLPRLEAAEASLLTARQRRLLHRLLDKGSTEALAIVILTALEQVGDREALPTVRKVASGKGANYHSARVQQAAQACLHTLESGRSRELAAQTLLRASDRLPVPANQLLRPAQDGALIEPQHLLRASTAEPAQGSEGLPSER